MKKLLLIIFPLILIALLVSCNGDVNSLLFVPEENYTPFTLKFVSDGTLSFEHAPDNLLYSLNGGSKAEFSSYITVASGDTVSLYADRTEADGFKIASTSPSFSVYGNIMSIIDADDYSSTTGVFYKAFYQLFGETKVTDASELLLPATTLANECYSEMFVKCSALTKVPELPATTLAPYCYDYMFCECTALTSAPELPATQMADACYAGMFDGCTSLTEAPELPATTLAYMCYMGMFSECTSLVAAPDLDATIMVAYCYDTMFCNCTSLTEAPELPSTSLAESCYEGMFNKCTALTEAPELPAAELVDSCYKDMFNNCSSLNSITCLATNINANDYATDWVEGVADSGTFVKKDSVVWETTGVSGIPTGWTVENYSTSKPLTLEFKSAGNFQVSVNGYASTDINLQYSKDGGTTKYDVTSDTDIAVSAGDKVCLFADRSSGSEDDYIQISSDTTYYAYGNVMSLIDSTNYKTLTTIGFNNAFRCLFDGDSDLKSHDSKTVVLPATTLSDSCYERMFCNCRNLTTAPELPATTMADYCYSEMFFSTGIETAPSLPATTLAEGCYNEMFAGTNIETAPSLPATTLAKYCYYGMFDNAASLDSLPNNLLPATTLAEGCYERMFFACTSLTDAPELPATTLVKECYSGMFNQCEALSSITCLATDISADDCTTDWVSDVASSGTFKKASTMSDWTTGTSGIPSGWTVADN